MIKPLIRLQKYIKEDQVNLCLLMSTIRYRREINLYALLNLLLRFSLVFIMFLHEDVVVPFCLSMSFGICTCCQMSENNRGTMVYQLEYISKTLSILYGSIFEQTYHISNDFPF